MAYKKYIQRNGKLYGPYIYKSKRVDGKVVSEYFGSGGEVIKKNEIIKRSGGVRNNNYKRFILILAGVFLLAFLIYLFAFSNYNKNQKFSGDVVLGVDTSYKSGKPLDGTLKFTLTQGELIPVSSKIIFENAGKSYEFALSEVFNEPALEGNYYITDKEISGEGKGYGLQGERTIYPDVEFVLQVYNEVSGEEVVNESVPDGTTTSEVIGNEMITSGTADNETTANETIAVEDNPTPITGGVVKKSGGFFSSLFGLTGMVSMELEKKINGVTSKDKPFIYELKAGESVELEPKSVKINGQEVSDIVVSLKDEEGRTVVSTDYSETQKGFGKEYAGNKEKTLSLDLSKLNLSLQEGNLDIKLVYGSEELLALNTLLKDGESSQGVVEQPVAEQIIPAQVNKSDEITIEENKTIQEIVNSSIWDMGDFLTVQERKILVDKFGNITLNSVKSELFKDRIIRGYDLGGYYAEYSYDSSLNKDLLDVQMQRDRIKFLKDIANSISKEQTPPKILEGFNETYIL